MGQSDPKGRSLKSAYVEGLTRDFLQASWGRPVLDVSEAGKLAAVCEATLREAIALGDLRGQGGGKRGKKLRVTCRALAEWIATLEYRTLTGSQLD